MLRTREEPPATQAGRDGLATEARGLVMRYGELEVPHGIDLAVPSGMVLGFLGPNGAGKPVDEVIGLVGLRQAADRRVQALAVRP